jgi:hypothetical protein
VQRRTFFGHFVLGVPPRSTEVAVSKAGLPPPGRRPDGFACLLMFGASEQGVRAAMFSEVSQEITVNIPKQLYN